MSDLTLTVDRLVVRTEAERQRLESAGHVAQVAFTLLAERLKGSPFERWGGARELVLDELEISELTLDDLLGSRGAERLADILYRRLLEALP
ncbi:MAG: hypothetical protein JST91_12670 [Actinobacteria bacterium]|nr:hypothetical protein [Actinomycetota bacterium]